MKLHMVSGRCAGGGAPDGVPRHPPTTPPGTGLLQTATARRAAGKGRPPLLRETAGCGVGPKKRAAGRRGSVPGRGCQGSRRADAATSDGCGRSRGGRRAARLDRSRSSECWVRRAVGIGRPSTLREITGFAGYPPKQARNWVPGADEPSPAEAAEAPAVQMWQLPVGVGGLAVVAGQPVWTRVVPASGGCGQPSGSAVQPR